MRTTIAHALDILAQHRASPDDDTLAELKRVVRRVQDDYTEIIENALSLLMQRQQEECTAYLTSEREKLDEVKNRIGEMITADGEEWSDSFERLVIEYLFTRARLVDELRQFPTMALELLERLTLDQSLAETIAFLENAMTGKKALFNSLMNYHDPLTETD